MQQHAIAGHLVAANWPGTSTGVLSEQPVHLHLLNFHDIDQSCGSSLWRRSNGHTPPHQSDVRFTLHAPTIHGVPGTTCLFHHAYVCGPKTMVRTVSTLPHARFYSTAGHKGRRSGQSGYYGEHTEQQRPVAYCPSACRLLLCEHLYQHDPLPIMSDSRTLQAARGPIQASRKNDCDQSAPPKPPFPSRLVPT